MRSKNNSNFHTDTYEVLFDDGFVKNVKAGHISKIKVPEAKTPKSASSGRKTNPHLPIPKFDLSKLNLLPVPKDGEWCCNWVNEIPIGAEGFLDGPDGHKRPTVLVEDWRLPTGWTKHLYQRSSVSGKWDVVLVSLSFCSSCPIQNIYIRRDSMTLQCSAVY